MLSRIRSRAIISIASLLAFFFVFTPTAHAEVVAGCEVQLAVCVIFGGGPACPVYYVLCKILGGGAL